MKDALDIIEKNYCGADGSFMFYLHERNRFNRAGYYKLVNCINELTKDRDFSRRTGDMIREIQLQTVLHLMYHFNPSDDYQIIDLPDDIFDISEDLRCATDAYFNEFVKTED